MEDKPATGDWEEVPVQDERGRISGGRAVRTEHPDRERGVTVAANNEQFGQSIGIRIHRDDAALPGLLPETGICIWNENWIIGVEQFPVGLPRVEPGMGEGSAQGENFGGAVAIKIRKGNQS